MKEGEESGFQSCARIWQHRHARGREGIHKEQLQYVWCGSLSCQLSGEKGTTRRNGSLLRELA